MSIIIAHVSAADLRGMQRKASLHPWSARWTVSRFAEIGDTVLFYASRPLSSLVATGEVASIPKLNDQPGHHFRGKYFARVDSINMLENPRSRIDIMTAIPDWGYWRSPIATIVVPAAHAGTLAKLVALSPKQFTTSDESGIEGARYLASHLRIERDSGLVRRKRITTLREKGRLACEVCDFDFHERYGKSGEGFCEVHHLQPLGHASEAHSTSLSDLAVLCANCHRMIHRGTRILSVSGLRRIVMARRRTGKDATTGSGRRKAAT
ncbi:MAG: endonuclease family protein [Gemmatimonadetes bacterium]|nr:endonuclease family protein [Gemmatimonadota bacterium]